MNQTADDRGRGTGRSAEDGAPRLLHEVFRRSARRRPEEPAVDIPPGRDREERRVASYADLDRLSDRLAEYLRPSVVPDAVVALLIPRHSILLHVAQLGVLKAGAAYACLDAAFPDGQVAEILGDAGARVLLTDADGVRRAEQAGWANVRCVDTGTVLEGTNPEHTGCSVSDSNFESKPSPDALAYLIYTSGTTGRPKGVMISHGSVVNLVLADQTEFSLVPGDRVAQGSSAAYDSSVEELWLAWAAGATAVVMDDDAARLGPDLIPWLQQERITVLCPPPTLLRTTGCERPWEALPELKLLYVGGEALPSDVADRWSRGRRLVNGYGPTECTVTAVRGPILSGQPVNIGVPVPGLVAWILDESMDEVPEGTLGELCLGGIGLARGYRNRPELTAEKFPIHPRLGRIYRTGDLVSRSTDGLLFCHGRIDSQVKIRGYRIELEAVEARLSECPGVQAAACCVAGEGARQVLTAFVVPARIDAPPSTAVLRGALSLVLPAYMVPARFSFIAELPRNLAGKINRRALAESDVADAMDQLELKPAVAPRDPVETRIAEAFARVLDRPGAVSVEQDFFSDLGGDSLSAALVVSRLRDDPTTCSVTVRDLYEGRTVRELAWRAIAGASKRPATPLSQMVPVDSITAARRFWVTLLQAVSLAAIGIVGAPLAYFAVFQGMPWLAHSLGWVALILLFPVGIFFGLIAFTLATVTATVVLKRLLIGAYRPGREPVWGSFYLRHWWVHQAARLIPWTFIEGTEFLNVTLRCLGARIGQRVHIHRGADVFRGGWDLLEIGDDVTLRQEASLRLVELEQRYLVMAPVVLESGCTLDIRSGLGGGTRVGANGFLTALSSLGRGGRIPAGERWDGIPARPAGRAPDSVPLPPGDRAMSPMAHGVVLIVARFLVGVVLVLPLELVALGLAQVAGVDTEAASNWIEAPTVTLFGVVLAAFSVVAPVPISLLLEAGLCRALGRIQTGVISRYGWGYIRVWLKTGLVQSAGNWLYGTLFWPWWLRWAGMKVGSDCEISTIIDVVPELVEIGSGSFLADGLYLGGPRILRGVVTLAPIRLSERTFLGNGVVIPAGQELPAGVLLGVLTIGDAAVCRAGSAWFGHPAFELPRREVVEAESHLTHHPSWIRRGNRVFWEALRFLIPIVPAAVFPLWCGLLAVSGGGRLSAEFLLCELPAATAAALLAPCLFVIALKWLLLGRVRPGVHPLWSCWASRWDFVCLAWSLLARDVIGATDGTLLQAWFLRLLGVSVGRGVVLGPGFAQDIPDPDMLQIGDGATVDGLFQAHTFEDRVLKIDRVSIGAHATIGHNAVLLYGSEIGVATRVEPHSVVMKRERLLAGQVYVGCPTRMAN